MQGLGFSWNLLRLTIHLRMNPPRRLPSRSLRRINAGRSSDVEPFRRDADSVCY
jgi:hypothetical protein